MIISQKYHAMIVLFASVFVWDYSAHASEIFGNGIIKQPTTVAGGTGTVANLQADDDAEYTVAKSATMTAGGFGAQSGTINSVYLFVQYSVESGYTGTNAIKVNGVNTTIVPANRDYGRWAHIDITGGSFGIDTSAEIASLSVTFNNNDGGIGTSAKDVLFDYVYVVVNPQTAIPIPPTWSEDFNGTGQANPAIWEYEVGYQRNNELQYYVPGTSNGWMEGGNFVIEARKDTADEYPGYEYTSASIITNNKFYWHYGRAQIRAKIPAKSGMWPAIWGTGETGQWPHNGEVDILEYYGEKILANCAVGNSTAWSANWFSSNKTVPSFEVVDANWRDSYHIWTMQWDANNVRIYLDNVLLKTVAQTSLKNADGTTAWGPQYPFMVNGMSCWLNLAMGGAGGNPTTTMNTGPQRYLIDYWRIWEGATDNVSPTNISISSNNITEGLPAGTIVGNLSATDADPAEVHRYTLVSGTGSTHNSQFTIPEFVSDSTLQGVIKTAEVLNFEDGPTRSIRVRVTDIEGATYDKVVIINVLGLPKIEVSQSSVTVAEGGTQTFNVRLRTLPASNITVNVSRQSGDSNITVSTGASLLFTPSNGTSWQTVTLAASQDADITNGVATILCSDPSSTYTSISVTVTEADNDNGAPVVDAGLDDTVFLTSSTLWTPAELALEAWYDASSIAAGTGTLSTWTDKSGKANHLTATGSPQTGARTINNLNAIDFSGACFEMTSAVNLLGKSIFIAAQTDDVSDTRILLGHNTINLQLRIDPLAPAATPATTPKLGFTAQTSYYPSARSIDSVVAGQASIMGFLLNTNMEFSLNGNFNDSGVTGSGAGTTTFNRIGRGDGTRKPFDGGMGEVVITSAIPSNSNREMLEGYLAHKWGTATNLPSDHTYKTATPSFASFFANLNGTVSDPEGQALITTWTLVSGPAGVVFGNPNTVDTTVSFTVAGTYVLRLSAYDGVDTTSNDVTMIVSEPNLYSNWAGGSFANSFTEIGYSRNPDGDVLTNLQEFAFGTDPTSPLISALSFTTGSNNLQPGVPVLMKLPVEGQPDAYHAVFSRRKNFAAEGLNYVVVFSVDLTTWTASTTGISVKSENAAGTMEAVSVPFPTTVPVTGGGPNAAPKFFRVGVSQP